MSFMKSVAPTGGRLYAQCAPCVERERNTLSLFVRIKALGFRGVRELQIRIPLVVWVMMFHLHAGERSGMNYV